MIKFLKMIFLGHSHEWKIIKTGPLVEGNTKVGTYYELQCKHCGIVKLKNLV